MNGHDDKASAVLKHKISYSLKDKGVLMAPLSRRDGAMIWPRFTDRPDSHMMVLHQPGMESRSERFIGSLSFCSGVEVVHLNHTVSPARQRQMIHGIAERLTKYQRGIDGSSPLSRSPLNTYLRNGGFACGCTEERTAVVLVMHGLRQVLSARRQDTMLKAYDDLRTVMDYGPSAGVHVIIMQDASDAGLVMLDGLHRTVSTMVVVGRLTPIAREMAFSSAWLPNDVGNGWIQCSDSLSQASSGMLKI